MRRIRKALLPFFLIATSFVATAVSVGTVKTHPTEVYVDPASIVDTTLVVGCEFRVNITVDHVEHLWGYQFNMSFNSEILYGLAVEVGPFLGSAGGIVMPIPGKGWNNTVGELRLTAACLLETDLAKSPTGGGVLAVVTFKVVGLGETKLRLGEGTRLMDTAGAWIIQGRLLQKRRLCSFLTVSHMVLHLDRRWSCHRRCNYTFVLEEKGASRSWGKASPDSLS